MADDKNNRQTFIVQAIGQQASSSLPTPLKTSSPTQQQGSIHSQQEISPPRGPRTLLLRRSDNGFGFTLRHFIVYPPESCCMLPGHERTRIDEPMDTIFVKQVRANSPAAEAGLRTGDRVVSVDGTPTRGEQYASVVQRIQQAGPWLRLLVVSKEDDILQRYFGETAHNPETNQRPRLRSPERLSQKQQVQQQRRSMTMIPGSSPRSRQSWVCSPSESLTSSSSYRDDEIAASKPQTSLILQRRTLQDSCVQGGNGIHRDEERTMTTTTGTATATTTTMTTPTTKTNSPVRKHSRDALDQSPQPYRTMTDSRYDLYDRTRPESIYSRPSNEQIYDRIKDPIYERVRPGELGKDCQQFGFPMSRAEPQVPIYRPGKRVVVRRASEGSGGSVITNDSEIPTFGSIDALRSSSDQISRSSINSRRDSSPASKDSLSSFESNSTLTGNECSDDSIRMTRLRKSFEQKEEFLRRPSQPIGWFMPEDVPRSSQPQPIVIQREFYARPQKLQRQVWPPHERQQSPPMNSMDKKILVNKPSNQNVQRVKTDIDAELECSGRNGTTQSEDSNNKSDPLLVGGVGGVGQSIRDRFYSSVCEGQKENNYEQFRTSGGGSGGGGGGGGGSSKSNNPTKTQFVSTLSRIHENVTVGGGGAQPQQDRLGQDGTRNGPSSLPSSPGPDKKPNDKFPVPPQGLQIVSKRAKQFESGRLLSDDDEPAGDRTNLYKSELSRLSNKRSVPNVAVRKREFESKAESQEIRRILNNRESKSLDSGKGLSGNRIIPVGSKCIHCEPPSDYTEFEDAPTMELEPMRLRARSNSAESWEAVNGSARRSARHTWQTERENSEEKQNNADNNNKPKRQDSYLQAVREQLAPGETGNNGVILRRQKNVQQITDEDRTTRRVSYLKATWGERMHVDSDLDLSDSEPVHNLRSNSIHDNSNSCPTPKDVEPVEREGNLHVKFTVLDGKRSTDRSWKQVWSVLRGPILWFYKDRHSQSPSSMNDESAGQNVDVRCSLVDVAEDYTKRKHVLRVANSTSEVLLQTEDAASMALWLRALHKHANSEKQSDTTSGGGSKQLAVPQTPTSPNAQSGGQRLSPLPSHKGIKKLTSFRNRSPTGQSPVNKTRKSSTSIEPPMTSPKSKTWKGRVAKQLRKMHGQAGSPSSPTAQLPPEGATFKVPLELCPPSSFSEFVPLIVEMCTSIVEARGLEVVGIYRVPGNTAAISQLTESVNKGFENINLQDPKWSDVNVISSLLKSFFRQLPDSLLTAELYPMFIDADKIEDPQRRMATIRKLLRDLPEHHFETLKHLMFHLKKVVEHSEVNKMEAKNLAIVFGPTLVRASGSRDNMVTMVTDMSHQCRIVESLLNNVDWFFSEEDLDDLSRLSVNLSLPADSGEIEPTSNANHNLLLNNIQKVEGMREMVSARDIVSSIISAANRKIQRRRKGQDEPENEEHEDEKAKAKQDVETSPVIRQSMALNERQCSVSEIVLMHESKNQSNHGSSSVDRAEKSNENSPNGSSSMKSKYLNQSPISSTSDSPRLSGEVGPSPSTQGSPGSNESKQTNDEVAIKTYAGLSATTQERIRRFEQETKAMLQRDQHKQRREAERREEERRRIEMEWQLAKREMENDDLLDSIVDTTVAPAFLTERLSGLNERLSDKSAADLSERHARSRSIARITPLSIAVQQQPTARQKAQASNQLSSILGEKINDGVIKKFKTDKEPSMESVYLPPIRYGSLDSLHEAHIHSHSSSSPLQQQRGIPGDVSDDGSDLLTSLTSTFDRKWKSLMNPLSQMVQQPTEVTVPSDANQVSSSDQTLDGLADNPSKNRQSTSEVYRDPSLHKSPIDKTSVPHSKNEDVQEKDTDSTVTEHTNEPNVLLPETPDNDRKANRQKKLEKDGILDATEKDRESKPDALGCCSSPPHSSENKLHFESSQKFKDAAGEIYSGDGGVNENIDYSNKLEKFENLAKFETRSRLKRSESLNKRSENNFSKLKRSESLNKHPDKLVSPTNGKLKRSESLNKHSDRSESPNNKLKRSESLTKTEKTECNISKRRQSVRKESATKLKRKNGMPERSIKRRHTVGGTKDFDKVHWLDNKLQSEAERVIKNDCRPKKSQLRTSSPDLSGNRVNVTDTSFLIEVSFRGPSNVVFNVTNARPQSLPDANLASKVFKVPLESHV